MNTMTGDLLSLARAGFFDVIVHGCNCFCTMGSGIAKQIRAEYPGAYEADCTTKKGDRDKLGSFTGYYTDDGFLIINAYTQFTYGAGVFVRADYEAIEKVFRLIGQLYSDRRIGYPRVGAGLAGGDWNIIVPLIETGLMGCHHTLVVLPK